MPGTRVDQLGLGEASAGCRAASCGPWRAPKRTSCGGSGALGQATAPQPICRPADSVAAPEPAALHPPQTPIPAGADMLDGMGGSGSGSLHLEGMPAQLSLLPAAPHTGAFQQPLLNLGLAPMHGLPALNGYGGWRAAQGVAPRLRLAVVAAHKAPTVAQGACPIIPASRPPPPAGMFGAHGAGGLLPLPLPGLTMEQPLPSFVIGRVDSKQVGGPNRFGGTGVGCGRGRGQWGCRGEVRWRAAAWASSLGRRCARVPASQPHPPPRAPLSVQAEALPADGYLPCDDPAGLAAADGSAALALGQQQLFMAQYQQHHLLLLQRQQALLAEQALQGQAASGSHSVTIAGIEPGPAPAPPNLAERPGGPAGRARRARRGSAAASGGAAGEEDEEGQQAESDSEGPKPKRRRRAAGSGQADGERRRCGLGAFENSIVRETPAVRCLACHASKRRACKPRRRPPSRLAAAPVAAVVRPARRRRPAAASAASPSTGARGGLRWAVGRGGGVGHGVPAQLLLPAWPCCAAAPLFRPCLRAGAPLPRLPLPRCPLACGRPTFG